AAKDFLGMQGDIWDAQWDMSLALVGSILALLTLSTLHNRLLKKNLSISLLKLRNREKGVASSTPFSLLSNALMHNCIYSYLIISTTNHMIFDMLMI
ncbi:DUF2238 domain-containing protein, partial [Bacillus wiedmannii]|uniref:DUF2238 domain-containing protein n=1 Tax=Bacillus wiedmannii TaxID=1890302 RepID=UPI003CE8953D